MLSPGAKSGVVAASGSNLGPSDWVGTEDTGASVLGANDRRRSSGAKQICGTSLGRGKIYMDPWPLLFRRHLSNVT